MPQVLKYRGPHYWAIKVNIIDLMELIGLHNRAISVNNMNQAIQVHTADLHSSTLLIGIQISDTKGVLFL